MKKIKLLTPFMGLTAIATVAMPLASCSSSEKIEAKIEATHCEAFTSTIELNKEFTIVCSPDAGYTLDTIKITIGNKLLTEKTDYAITNNMITVKPAAVTDKEITIKIVAKLVETETVEVKVESEEIEVVGGTQTINFDLGTSMKNKTVDVSVNNDPSNYVNLEVVQTNMEVELDDEGKGSVNVKFVENPTAQITSKYSLLFQYENSEGKTRIISSDVITVNYKAEDPIVYLDWATCSWTDLINAVNKGEVYFVKAFKKNSIKDFVGLTKKVKMYDNPNPDSKRNIIEQEVRVIGVNHDSYLDGDGNLTQALLTFEFVDLIDSMIWKPDQTKQEYIYKESQVYKHFHNTSTYGGFVFRFKGSEEEKIDSVIIDNLKPVIKACTEFDYITKEAKIDATAMHFFSLSPTELGMSDNEWQTEYSDYEMLDEGWAYNYYENASTDHTLRRKKLNKKGTAGDYADYHTRTVCLPSAGSGDTKFHWATCAQGSFGEYLDAAGEAQGIDVAFCI